MYKLPFCLPNTGKGLISNMAPDLQIYLAHNGTVRLGQGNTLAFQG